MNAPPPEQLRLFGQLIAHAGDLAPILEAQFAASRTMNWEFCGVCFDMEMAGDVPLLPEGLERPLLFEVDSAVASDLVQVLLWHDDGRLNAIEVSAVDDPHPGLRGLQVIDWPRENQAP
ncbi:hypothetical protein NCCP1664_17620 [Zafaria cholistanensis]|uniref:Uncharacterized protein n=1 Tax=Zafaria cholistanensis TaxID=1682741 RepID=A0A5A7NRS4_9MICC|nr:hypothetical protein [Zafaria cholistanensis]GER23266.1 hypothetical protein NCCP1664_17620 [Zafaria cholistanensis]